MCNMTPYEPFWDLTHMVSDYKIWPLKMFAKLFQDIWWKINAKYSPVLEKLAITVLKSKTLVLSLMGSYYIKYFFQLYFWNRNEIIFLLMCNMTPYESFWDLTPLVSYYKIWPPRIFDKKIQDIWWKNQWHIKSSSPEVTITVLKAKILVWSLMGSYYTKYFFQIYFWNRYEIIFLLTCNMTP